MSHTWHIYIKNAFHVIISLINIQCSNIPTHNLVIQRKLCFQKIAFLCVFILSLCVCIYLRLKRVYVFSIVP